MSQWQNQGSGLGTQETLRSACADTVFAVCFKDSYGLSKLHAVSKDFDQTWHADADLSLS